MLFDSIVRSEWQENLANKAKKKAREEGKHGRPSPDALTFDSNETEYKTSADGLINKARNIVYKQIEKFSHEIGKYKSDLQTADQKAQNIHDYAEIKQEAEAELQEARDHHVMLLAKRMECDGHLRAFKRTHDIQFDPDHPEDKLHFLSLVFLIFVFESVFNTIFWKGDGGLIGALPYAAAFSGINIALALVLGAMFRYKNLGDQVSRLIGWAALPVAVASGLLYAVWIATQRSQKEMGQILDPEIGAALSSVPNTLFLCGTIIAACFAFYKGYYLLGTIPGYKRVADDYKVADHAVRESIATVKSSCTKIYDKAIRERDDLIRNIKDVLKNAKYKQVDIDAIRPAYQQTVERIHTGYRYVIRVYRDENQHCRPKNINGPAYWSDELELDSDAPEQLQVAETAIGEVVDAASVLDQKQTGILLAGKSRFVQKKGDFIINEWHSFCLSCESLAKAKYISEIAYLGKNDKGADL